ncbi:MAG TPA: 4Fe-4S binding protein [Candidatus Omnitrophota bacterium]|nr:4Fe-4S binding protein [Candidatus Omnitrophota bacterium]HPD84862.1 4Fe-4S binding protein [Candidatus Omnitrophota bacterium]HRZ03720.1 4Fe-4S binding protein [Candidatus Omnitrophota bacterium]
MSKRKIININEEKCTGCGLCIPNCPEGALQIIDGKARLISDLFCDGLGACIGHCPEGAITIEEREAEKYDEEKVIINIVKQGPNVVRAHLEHLKEHNETEYLKEATDYLARKGIMNPLEKSSSCAATKAVPSGCPGSRMMDLREGSKASGKEKSAQPKGESQLRQWPVQIMLVPPHAPYLENCDLLIAADCVPFAYADFHQDLLQGKVLLVGCPKLDDMSIYEERLSEIIKNNTIKSVTYAHMEVPCCFGLVGLIEQAIADSGKKIPFNNVTISIRGEKSS